VRRVRISSWTVKCVLETLLGELGPPQGLGLFAILRKKN
jgi:hypothetical protein